jgi:hypothetical protein
MQEAVRACARLRLILTRPDLYIATVLHARCLLTVVSEVPIINVYSTLVPLRQNVEE